MRKLILAVLGCCFLITESVPEQYEFGDIISFKRKCSSKSSLTYKHFAIFVDSCPGMANCGNHDIFQRTKLEKDKRRPTQKKDCIFDDLSKERAKETIEEKKDNYLEEYGYKAGTQEEMAARIQEKLHKCGGYSLLCNNCEHLATYVRYGVRISLQKGASTAAFCKSDKRKCKAFAKVVQELRESEEAQQKCEEAGEKDSKSG